MKTANFFLSLFRNDLTGKTENHLSQKKIEYAKFVFFMTIVIHCALIFGLGIWKVSWFPEQAFLFIQLAMPFFALLLARTWISAFKYAILSSLVHPIGMAAAGILVAVLSLLQNRDFNYFIKGLPLIGLANGALWILLLSMVGPSLLLAVALRILLLRLKSRTR